MPDKNVKSKIKFFLLLLAMFLLLVISYCYVSGKNEYKIATDALGSNDYDNAVAHYARSIVWHVPFASYVPDSIDGIMGVGRMYESQNNNENAKYAYNILRGALYSIRSAYRPFEDKLLIVNERIAALNAAEVMGTDDGAEHAKEKDAQLKILNDKGKPDLLWSAIASLSFFGWVFAMLTLIMRLFKNNVVNLNSNVILTTLVLVCFYVVWLISLVKA